MSDETIDPRLVEQTRQQIRQLVAEIDELAGSNIPPQQFYPEFLQRVVAAVAAVGGAVWMRDDKGTPTLLHHVNFAESGLLDEAALANGHGGLLNQKFNDGQPELLMPRSNSGSGAGGNPSDLSLIISPLKVDAQPVGVVEVLLDPTRREAAQQNAVHFVSELCDMGAEYVRNQQLRRMMNQQEVWSELETFTREIHQSLDPKEVAYLVANEGKRLVRCDRVSVGIKYGRRAVIEGVSGQEVVEKRGNLVRLMTRLTNAVIRSDEDLVYAGDAELSLPPAVQDALDDFLAESDSKTVVVKLLRNRDKDGNAKDVIGAMVAEELEEMSSSEDISTRVEAVSQHACVSINNALNHHRVFMLPVWRAVGNSTHWLRGNRLAKAGAAVGIITVVVLAMIFVPWELRLEGKGEILPRERREVFASEIGEVTSVDIVHAQYVEKDQKLLQLESFVLESEIVDLEGRIQQAITQALSRGSSGQANIEATLAKLTQEYAKKEREILRERQESLTVRAPIAGMIATQEPKRILGKKPVNRGDPLVTVYEIKDAENGDDWILEIKMPEDRMGHIREAQDLARRGALPGREEGDTRPLTAQFILGSHPETKLHGHIVDVASTAELDQEEREHTVLIKIALENVSKVKVIYRQGAEDVDETEERLEPQIVNYIEITFDGANNNKPFRLYPGAEVTAKVECGKRSLGFVMLREIIEFVYEAVIF